MGLEGIGSAHSRLNHKLDEAERQRATVAPAETNAGEVAPVAESPAEKNGPLDIPTSQPTGGETPDIPIPSVESVTQGEQEVTPKTTKATEAVEQNKVPRFIGTEFGTVTNSPEGRKSVEDAYKIVGSMNWDKIRELEYLSRGENDIDFTLKRIKERADALQSSSQDEEKLAVYRAAEIFLRREAAKKEGNPESDKEKNKIEAGQPQEDAKDTETIDADSGSREEKEEGKEKTQEATLDSRKGISDLRTELWKLRVEAGSPDSSEGIELKIRELEDKLRVSETVAEGTPKENREKLKEVVGRFENDEHVKTYKEYLGNRSEELNTEAKKSGLEGAFRWMGEKYNKLGWKSKLGVGLALGISGAAFTTVSMPIAFACMSGIAIQRVAGLASSFLKYEKKGKGKEGFWAGKEGAMLKAMAYSFGMSAAIGEAVHLASESSYGEMVHGWLKHHYPFGHAEVATHGQAHTMHDYETMKGMLGQEKPKISIDEMLGHNATNAISNEQIANMSADTMPDYSQMMPTDMDHVGISAPEVSALEMPDISVEASTGHGYEWMMKRMYEQLNDANLDPEQYPEGSDIRQLLDADDSTIDAVVHRIASNPDHGFFNPDGTSIQIDHDAYMTIDADGQINLDDAMHASPDAATTPEYHHPEAPVSHTNDVPDEGADTGSAEGVSGQPPAEAPAAPAETKVPEAQTTPVEHPVEWTNSNGVKIDPLHGDIFHDRVGATIAYGNDFDARFEAAQEFAKANPGTSVWVQAEHPVLDPTTNTLRPWIHELIYEKGFAGIGGGMKILNPVGPTSLDQIGTINPEEFTNKVWWRGIKFGESE